MGEIRVTVEKFTIGDEGKPEGRRVSFADGGVVFIKGDVGDCAYVVKSGRVEIRESGRVIEVMEPGELFGEMALIDSEPRSASAVAVERTELVVIDQQVFNRLVREEQDFAVSVMRLMSRRLRAAMAAARSPVDEMPMPIGISPRKAS
jgi:CRP/FNR family cyclic AMP-dependent transcriptional regulator